MFNEIRRTMLAYDRRIHGLQIKKMVIKARQYIANYNAFTSRFLSQTSVSTTIT